MRLSLVHQINVNSLHRLIRIFRHCPFLLGNKRHCPVCNRNSARFGEFGVIRRKDAECLWCGALERHRLVWLFFFQMTNLFDGVPKRMLHIAPEPFFQRRLQKRLGDGYLTSDLHDTNAMVKMDVTDIQYPDNTFDIIYCSHVLEHVHDDRKALREFFRILKPRGSAFILSPITSQNSVEAPSILDPSERLRLFGQPDHVRVYGLDFADRLRESGFVVKVITASDFLSKNEILHMGITSAAGDIFACTKQEEALTP
jgi:hypothetical protein